MSDVDKNTNDKKKWYNIPGILGVILTFIVWIATAIFYFGVHKAEMAILKSNFEKFSTELIEQKTVLTDHAKQISKINNSGSEALISKEKDIIALKSKVDLLENLRLVGEQKDLTVTKDISGLDVRITRLEDAIPKISLMGQRVENLEKMQTEMKTDLKDLSRMPVQIAELKSLIIQSNK